jgi:hypothetical protein
MTNFDDFDKVAFVSEERPPLAVSQPKHIRPEQLFDVESSSIMVAITL